MAIAWRGSAADGAALHAANMVNATAKPAARGQRQIA
jgi:hypothetical protein